ncbi:hypothetical protein GCM10028895_52440 [Pontibacter rugosus]
MYLKHYIAKPVVGVAALFLLASSPTLAHGGEKHGKEKAEPATETAVDTVQDQQVGHDTMEAQLPLPAAGVHTEVHEHTPSEVHASLSDFPNTHPLIVHFPIMLLLVAAAVLLANIFSA